MSGSFSVGMEGPGEPIVLTLAAPTGVDFTAASVRSLSVTWYFAGGATLTLEGSDWTLSAITASSMKATYIPAASDFTRAGKARMRTRLTIDGVAYRYRDQTETIEEGP